MGLIDRWLGGGGRWGGRNGCRGTRSAVYAARFVTNGILNLSSIYLLL